MLSGKRFVVLELVSLKPHPQNMIIGSSLVFFSNFLMNTPVLFTWAFSPREKSATRLRNAPLLLLIPGLNFGGIAK